MNLKRINFLSRHWDLPIGIIRKEFINKNNQIEIDWFYFVNNQNIEKDDIVIVMDYPKGSSLNIINSPLILWQSEPYNIYDFPIKYIEKFDYLITSFYKKDDTKVTYINWWITFCAFQTFLINEKYEDLILDNVKSKNISLITSNITVTSEHIKRVKFVKFLKKRQNFIDILWFNHKIYLYDWFKDYKYTIVLENTIQENHFTEKIVDALKCWCFVFYHWCSNIHNYFDKNSVIKININNMQWALDMIKFHINNNSYGKNIESIKKNKEIALNMNPYLYLVKIIKSNNIKPWKNFWEKNIFFDKSDSPIYFLWKLRYFYILKYLIYKYISKIINYLK